MELKQVIQKIGLADTNFETVLFIISKPYPLVILFFGDLFNLVKKLSNSKLKLRKLFLLRHVGVVYSVFSHLNVKMDPLKKRRNAVSAKIRCQCRSTK